ncbi:Oidioi.mRNA.OKI2018_I69.chr2.g5058.t1.cds [Oikopleura dioica]|uniref:Oidioi.mRNA.OKI2018_I69.chr2.g5058.t1.cds n=1 Tax=Oikopleura dioica TaxID=34765 RepID=A0ABN7SZC8_OIKDI|nr:Oidioi.mRNA.OKI2018_I69.chr2.g5058.t1.cds [Oikopleura dioica]
MGIIAKIFGKKKFTLKSTTIVFSGRCAREACSEEGRCPYGCEFGWKNGDDGDCTEPICQIECAGPTNSSRNYCVSPNECICGEKNWAKREIENYGSFCYSLRANGLKGAIFALVILICAITACDKIQGHLLEQKRGEQVTYRRFKGVEKRSRTMRRPPTVSRIHEDSARYRRIEIIEEEM